MAFAEIVLVLADADRLGVDLHQFGQRILQAPRDRHRAAHGHVELRQFLRREGRGRIDGGPGLGDHDLGHFLIGEPLDQLDRQLLGFPRRRAVADGDEIDVMRDREFAEHRERLVPAPLRLMREHRGGREHLAGRIDHGDLDAGAIAGIEPHGDPRPRRRRQQEIAEVRREDVNRLGFRRRP